MHWLLIGYMFLFIHRPFELWPVLGDLHVERVYILGVMLAWAVWPGKRWVPNPQHVAYFAFATAVLFCWAMSPWADDGQVVVENWFKILVFYVLLVTSAQRREGAAPPGGRVPARHGRVHAALAARVRRRAVHVPHGHRPDDRRGQLARRPEQLRGEHRVRPAVRPGLLAVGPQVVGAAVLWRLRGLSVGCILLTGSRSSFLGLILWGSLVILRSRHRWAGIPAAARSRPARCSWPCPESLQTRFETIVNPDVGPENARVSGEGRIEGPTKGMELIEAYPATGIGPGSWRPATGASWSRTTCTANCAARWARPACSRSGRSSSASRINLRWMRRGEPAGTRRARRRSSTTSRSAVGMSVFLLLFEGNFGHNLFRHNWLWFGGFLIIARHVVQRRLAVPAAGTYATAPARVLCRVRAAYGRSEPEARRGHFEGVHCPRPAPEDAMRSLSVAALLLAAGPLLAETPKRPNIVWIVAEDICPNLGCYGDKDADHPEPRPVRGPGGPVHALLHARPGLRPQPVRPRSPACTRRRSARTTCGPPSRARRRRSWRSCGRPATSSPGRAKTDFNFAPPKAAFDSTQNWMKKGQLEGAVLRVHQPRSSPTRARSASRRRNTTRTRPGSSRPSGATRPRWRCRRTTPTRRRCGKDVATYHDNITAMDYLVGDVLKWLDDKKLADNTVVFFFGDHGWGMPRGKRWPYDSGLHVPFLVRWPGTIKPGTVREDLVAFLDFAPTVLTHRRREVAGADAGASVPRRERRTTAKYVFAARDRMDETFDRIRTVRDERLPVHPQLLPGAAVRPVHPVHGRDADHAGLAAVGRRRQADRPADALLRSRPSRRKNSTTPKTDPHEIKNLADDPARARTS